MWASNQAVCATSHRRRLDSPTTFHRTARARHVEDLLCWRLTSVEVLGSSREGLLRVGIAFAVPSPLPFFVLACSLLSALAFPDFLRRISSRGSSSSVPTACVAPVPAGCVELGPPAATLAAFRCAFPDRAMAQREKKKIKF